VSHILIKCPRNLRPVRTGLTTDMVIFETLPPVALPLRCPACRHVHRWKPEDAWVTQVATDSTNKSLDQINKSADVRKATKAVSGAGCERDNVSCHSPTQSGLSAK
jgi:hypothetical protein